MPVVWSDRQRLHEPGGEVWVGVRTPGTEVPRAPTPSGRRWSAAAPASSRPRPHPDEALLRSMTGSCSRIWRGAWEEWRRAGLTASPGRTGWCPTSFPSRGLLAGARDPAVPAAAAARAGYFAYDTMTLIGPGTWEAARGAVDAALTAADLVAGGEPAAYACCRPPGHHATRSAFGGSCYLNNAAAAAARLRAGLEGRWR